MFYGRYVFYSETFKLLISSINLHNFSSSLFRSLETCPSRSCFLLKNIYFFHLRMCVDDAGYAVVVDVSGGTEHGLGSNDSLKIEIFNLLNVYSI